MKIISKQKEKHLSIFSFTLVVILMLAEINESKILLGVLFVGLALLFFKPVYMLPVYIISSLGNSFLAYDGISISRYIGFLLIAACITYQIQNQNSVNKSGLYFIIAFAIYTYFSSLFSITGSFLSFMIFIQSLLILFLLSQLRKVNLYNLSWILVASSAASIILFSFWFRDLINDLDTQRLSAGQDSSINRFATMISQLLAMMFISFFIGGKNKSTKIFLISIMCMGIFLIILTGTRTALISVILSSLIFLCVFKDYTKKIVIYLPLILFAIYLLVDQVQDLDFKVIDRFSAEVVENDGGSGRIAVWKALVPETLENGLFFGFGFGAENVYFVAKQHGFGYSAHNFLIDMFTQMGLSGVILFCTYFLFLAKKLFKYAKHPLIILPIMILLTGLMNGIGETIFTEKFFWNGIALSWIYLNNLPRKVRTYKQTITN